MKWALCWQQRAWCGAQIHKPWGHDLSWCQMLNWLSHPGTPTLQFWLSKHCSIVWNLRMLYFHPCSFWRLFWLLRGFFWYIFKWKKSTHRKVYIVCYLLCKRRQNKTCVQLVYTKRNIGEMRHKLIKLLIYRCVRVSQIIDQ